MHHTSGVLDREPPLGSDAGLDIHALIIGIDRYESRHISDLSGAVADADAMEQYIRHLHPRADITVLRNEEATRLAIIQELEALQHHDVVHNSDPFLFYFAGHGTAAQAPDDWPTGSGRISMLVPHDGTKKRGNSTRNIPDHTIASLLHQLAEKMGRDANITVMFDCCHSGSGTRNLGVEDISRSTARGFDMDDAKFIPDALHGRGIEVPAGFVMAGTTSHVLLAACAEDGQAFEKVHGDEEVSESGGDVCRGVFTKALLEILMKAQEDTTYQDLMDGVSKRVQGQTPRCEGYRVNRKIFRAPGPSATPRLVPVRVEDGVYKVLAGSALGIKEGTQLFLSKTENSRASDCVTAFASDVFAGSCDVLGGNGVALAVDLDSPFKFALPITTGPTNALRLHVSHTKLKELATSAIELFKTKDSDGVEPTLAAGIHETDLSIDFCQDSVHYTISGPDVHGGRHKLYGLTNIPTAHDLYWVVRTASYFFWHLRRGPSFIPAYYPYLTVEAHALKLVDDSDGPRYVQRDDSRDLLRSGILEAVVGVPKTVYGFKVVNNSQVDLHLWAFYFDCSNLSICTYYRPPSVAPDCDPCLRGHTSLMIGYGPSGGRPVTYALPEGRDSDVGFVRFFVSTRPIDLSGVEQDTAFSRQLSRASVWADPPPPNNWCTLKITVVQRAHASNAG
ncbi:hypothetical protein PENSPDRAFT_759837 [Peniophora sp. CONT]|nr:hypothetical protein PENSPDRAFT_759837 [Peniophora sp. CONT]